MVGRTDTLAERQVVTALSRPDLADPFGPVPLPKSREDLADDRRRDRAVGTLQAAALGGLLAVCALALPTQRVQDGALAFVQATSGGAWVHPHLALMPLARLLAEGLGAERAWYVLSALCAGAALPFTAATLLALGIGRMRALAAAGIAFLTPAALLAATTPGPYGPALLGAAIAAFGAAGREGLSPARHARRAALGWVVACTLFLGHALLLPAVVAAVTLRGGAPSGRKEREVASAERATVLGWLAAAPALLLALLLLGDLVPARASGGDFLRAALAAVLGGDGTPALRPIRTTVALALGLGPALLGLGALCFPQGKDRRTALFAALWAAGALAPQVLHGPAPFGLTAVGLLPLAALGFALGLRRLAADAATSRAALLAALGVVVVVGFRTVHHRADPDRAWSERAAGLLSGDDVFLSRDANHLYIAAERFGVEALDLREPVELAQRYRDAYWSTLAQRVADAHSEGRRIVTDVGPRGSLTAIREFPFRKELHRLGLRAPLVQLEQLAAEARQDRYRAVQERDLFPGEIEEASIDPGGAPAP